VTENIVIGDKARAREEDVKRCRCDLAPREKIKNFLIKNQSKTCHELERYFETRTEIVFPPSFWLPLFQKETLVPQLVLYLEDTLHSNPSTMTLTYATWTLKRGREVDGRRRTKTHVCKETY
jgi:hypothetical protein